MAVVQKALQLNYEGVWWMRQIRQIRSQSYGRLYLLLELDSNLACAINSLLIRSCCELVRGPYRLSSLKQNERLLAGGVSRVLHIRGCSAVCCALRAQVSSWCIQLPGLVSGLCV